MVSERTSLLPSLTSSSGGGSCEQYKAPHPEICIRTTVSPWDAINQKLLVYIRVALATFFSAVLVVDITQEAKYGRFDSNLKIKAFFFYLSNISWINQTVYFYLTAYWTILEDQDVDSAYRSERHRNHRHPLWKTPIYWCDHVPQGRHHRYTRFIFSFFYTLTVTIPFVVTLGYWTFMFEEEHFKSHPTKAFCIASIHGFSSLATLLEIIFLNSQEPQEPLWAHLLMLIPFGFAYYGWLWIGKAITGAWMYDFVDPHWHDHGKRDVAYAVLAAFAIAYVMFFFQYVLHIVKKYFMDRYGR